MKAQRSRAIVGALALVIVLTAIALSYLDLPSGTAGARPGGVATEAGVPEGMPAPPSEATARDQLGGLRVAPAGSMRGYTRERFSHWSSQGDNCTTRELVLKRDGEDVAVDEECAPQRGRWFSAYDSRWIGTARGIDIDHMVPLANAWRSGANRWSDERREAFANDLERGQLIAVSAGSNRAKGDQDPSQWRPGNQDLWCQYARWWIDVKHHYALTITTAERSALREMLDRC